MEMKDRPCRRSFRITPFLWVCAISGFLSVFLVDLLDIPGIIACFLSVVVTAPLVASWFMSRWFGLLLLLAQAAVWLLVAESVIGNPNLPDGIAWTGIAVPLIVSVLAWRLAYRGWGWRLDPSRPNARQLRNHRRVCVLSVIAFVFLHLLVSGTLRRDAVESITDAARSKAEMEGWNMAIESLTFARTHFGRYPQSLAELPREHLVNGWWSGSDGVRHPNTEGLDDKTVADEANFEYFGKGLTNGSPPGIVVIASKEVVPDRAHVLITTDDQHFWVGPIGFSRFHHFLEQHVPRDEWNKGTDSASKKK
jgi:hypothetical protein